MRVVLLALLLTGCHRSAKMYPQGTLGCVVKNPSGYGRCEPIGAK